MQVQEYITQKRCRVNSTTGELICDNIDTIDRSVNFHICKTELQQKLRCQGVNEVSWQVNKPTCLDILRKILTEGISTVSVYLFQKNEVLYLKNRRG